MMFAMWNTMLGCLNQCGGYKTGRQNEQSREKTSRAAENEERAGRREGRRDSGSGFERQLTDEIDRELGKKYYRKASKEACDNAYYILLCSEALALHDHNPAWGSEAIGKRLQATMDYVERFAKEYEGNLAAYIKRVEDETGLQITVDSTPVGGTE